MEKRVEVNDHSAASPLPHPQQRFAGLNLLRLVWTAPQALAHKGGKIQYVHAQMGTITQDQLNEEMW